jgi:hypothetical protein
MNIKSSEMQNIANYLKLCVAANSSITLHSSSFVQKF